jgi:predicted RNase H-like HicB family nuclease
MRRAPQDGAYCPDLPGLGAAGASREEVEGLIHEAIELHIESLRKHGEPLPLPTSAAGVIAVSVAWPHHLGHPG